MTEVPIEVARSTWIERQGLDEPTGWRSLPGGWLRSIGGVEPYLSLFARDPGLARSDVDSAFATGALRVVPGVRGCIWTVSKADAPLAVAVAGEQARRRLELDLRKAGVGDDEIARVRTAVLDALGTGPTSTRRLAGDLSDGVVRSLGEVGKKVGLTTTLPPALRGLELEGAVTRALAGNRLEREQYEWTLHPAGVGDSPAARDPTEQARALARLYFDWAGPATFDEFVKWTGLKRKPARAAVEALGLTEVNVAGIGACLCLPELAAEVVSGIPLLDDHVLLLPTLDNLLSLRAAPGACFASADHQDVEIRGLGARSSTVGTAGWVTQRPLFVGGRWAGFWEWDAEVGEAIWGAFGPIGETAEAEADRRAAAVGAFVRDHLDGQARTVSIDSEKRQRARVEAVRALRG